MTSIADDLAKRRPLPILSRENYQRWFELAEMNFEAEGISHTISEPYPAPDPTALLQEQMDKLNIDKKVIGTPKASPIPPTPTIPIATMEKWRKDMLNLVRFVSRGEFLII